MPKNNGAYQSADDYLDGNFRLIKSQKQWFLNYVKLWDSTNGGEDI